MEDEICRVLERGNNTYRILVENLKESNFLEDLGINGMIMI